MKFLICQDEVHADLVDHLIMDMLREKYGARGSNWSGIFYEESKDRYAVLWGSPVSDLFGPEDVDPSLVVVEGELVVRNDKGQVVLGTWESWVPPVLVEAPL